MSDASGIRRQLTLFLNNAPSTLVECRNRFNPVQAALIDAHVTLCREDEVTDWDAINQRLSSLVPFQLPLQFGKPVRDGNSVLMQATEGVEKFTALRRKILDSGNSEPRQMYAHITVIHPRNGTCSDEDFVEIERKLLPFKWTFSEICLIEQHQGGPWKLLTRYQ